MLLIIAYACFSSAYYCAFDFPKGNQILVTFEHAVFSAFTLDIIFNLVRVPDSMVGPNAKRDHFVLLKRYFKSGWLVLDLLATFPFYLINTSGGASSLGMWFKLLRLVRLPKILNLLDLARFNKFVETVVSGQTRGKRVVYQLIMKNVYKVFRLILLTVIITYFTGCAFYFISSFQSDG
jgi:hypothetical protein